MSRVAQKLPTAATSALKHIPHASFLYQACEKMLQNPLPDFKTWMPQVLTAGQMLMEGFSSLLLVYALMTYLLIDGDRTFRWLRAFFRPETRTKIDHTAREVTVVISAYMIGQLITSVLCGAFVYAMLRFLEVPGALMLAVIAGVFDILPIIGFFLSVIPSIIFALTVSPTTALIVFALYCTYHALENYVVVPLIYGNRLRLSGLAVLVAILVGVLLGGILGAIVILPVVASYPIIERIWLIHLLGENVVGRHEKIESET